ncbi:MAG: hypothetical protein KJ915_10660 [Candidatus Omnitrophica bacterium]|nr:hypothetical protein [Candidatus Omnitrophota bacterium]
MNFLKKHYIFISLIGIFLLYIITDIIILNVKGDFLLYQEAIKMGVCSHFYEILSQRQFSPSPYIYPPIYFLVSSFLCVIAGRFSYITCVYANFIYLAIFLSSFFLLARKIIKNNSVALLAVYILFIFNYDISIYSRYYSMEFAVGAFVCLSLYFLICTDNFTNFKRSFLFGLAFGLSMLIKWTAFIYILPPLLVYIWNALAAARSSKSGFKTVLINIVVSFCIFLALFLYWVLTSLDLNRMYNLYCIAITKEAQISGLSTYIAVSFTALMEYILFTKFFLQGRYLIDFLKGRFRFKKFLIFWLLGPILILSFAAGITRSRYMIPVLPALALMSALAFNNIKEQRAKRNALYYFLIGGALMFTLTSFWGNYADAEYNQKVHSIKDMLKTMEDKVVAKEKIHVLYLYTDSSPNFDYLVKLFKYFLAHNNFSNSELTISPDEFLSINIDRAIAQSEYILIVDKDPRELLKKISQYNLTLVSSIKLKNDNIVAILLENPLVGGAKID